MGAYPFEASVTADWQMWMRRARAATARADDHFTSGRFTDGRNSFLEADRCMDHAELLLEIMRDSLTPAEVRRDERLSEEFRPVAS